MNPLFITLQDYRNVISQIQNVGNPARFSTGSSTEFRFSHRKFSRKKEKKKDEELLQSNINNVH